MRVFIRANDPTEDDGLLRCTTPGCTGKCEVEHDHIIVTLRCSECEQVIAEYSLREWIGMRGKKK